jgi:hypothetical protein
MADRESVTHRGSGDESGGEAARPPEGNPGRMADPLPPPSIGGESIDWAERGLDSALPIGSAEPSGIGTLEEEAPVFGAGSVSGGRGRRRIGDRVFSALASGSGLFVVVLILLVAIFLVARAIPAIADDQSTSCSPGIGASKARRFGSVCSTCSGSPWWLRCWPC